MNLTEKHNLTLPDCANCSENEALGFDIAMALQPIVNVTQKKVFAQEALVRGPNGEGAGEVFKNVNSDNLYRFDQTCRVKAVELASRLDIDGYVSINFMPNAIYKPELCIRATVAAAHKYNFPIDRIIFEFTEVEEIRDSGRLKYIVDHYQKLGFLTAIDDFGAGYSGLGLLADVQTDLIKLDMALIRDIDKDKNRQAIVKGAVSISEEMNITVIAEGIESYEEMRFLQDAGIELQQGYYFAKPVFQGVADIQPEIYNSKAA